LETNAGDLAVVHLDDALPLPEWEQVAVGLRMLPVGALGLNT
jgi:hypothetical protein